jgi:hypothetical protein
MYLVDFDDYWVCTKCHQKIEDYGAYPYRNTPITNEVWIITFNRDLDDHFRVETFIFSTLEKAKEGLKKWLQNHPTKVIENMSKDDLDDLVNKSFKEGRCYETEGFPKSWLLIEKKDLNKI